MPLDSKHTAVNFKLYQICLCEIISHQNLKIKWIWSLQKMTFTLYLLFFERLQEYTAPRQMQTFMFGLYFASEQTKDISHIECFCLLPLNSRNFRNESLRIHMFQN